MDTQTPPQGAPKAAGQPGFMAQLENFFDTYFHKKVGLHLPTNFKEWLVKFSPWIIIILIILSIPTVLALLGLNAFLYQTRDAYGYYYHATYSVSGTMALQGLLILAALVLQAVAVPGLFARSFKAWHLVYYSTLLYAIGLLLGGWILNFIVYVALSIYFLFQVREYYK